MLSCKQKISSENGASQLHPELHLLCRICLQEAHDSRSIFDLDHSVQLAYSERVMQCVDVEIYPNESLPNKICLQCIQDLDVACRFRANCTSSNVVLQTYLTYNGLENHAPDTQQPQSEPDGEEEIAIHLDTGVMYTFKPPTSLDVKMVRLGAEENIHNAEKIPMESTGSENDGPAEGSVSFEPETMELEPGEIPKWDFPEKKINAMKSGQERTTRTSIMVTGESTIVHSKGNQLPNAIATASENVKTLKTIRKTNTPNETKPTIEAITTQPAEDGSGVETVIRVKRNITTAKPEFVCKLCNVTYKHKHALETHMRRHRGERPYKCDFCEKSFVVPFELQRHQRIHTGQKPYKCKYCDRAYSDFSSKTKHERTHTGERPYECYYCGKTFSYSHVLNSHLLVHTGEKKYCCTICGKRFAKAHHLKSHGKTHPPLTAEVSSNEADIAVDDITNTVCNQETTDFVYTDMLQDELIAAPDDAQQISVHANGVLIGSYPATSSSGLSATNAWTTMVNSITNSDNTATGIVPHELENEIVSFTDYIIKNEGLDDLMVVPNSVDEALAELVGQAIMER